MNPQLRTRSRIALGSLLAWLLLGTPTPAAAQTDAERAGARAAATEGYQAMQEHRWADAIDRFTRAESLVHAPPHLLYLARAYANLGKLVESQEIYQKLTREVLPPKAPDAFASAQADGARELAQLEPRVPTLRIDVPPSFANVVVTMDGKVVPSALLGLASPVDPGDHTIRATADGATSKSATVSVAEGAHATFPLVFQPLAAAQPATPESALAPTQGNGTLIPVTTDGGPRGTTVAGIAALAVGAAGLGVGVGFAVASHNAKSQGDALCPGGVCPDSAMQQIQSYDSAATRNGTVAITGFVVGGVAAAVGAALLVFGAHSPAERAAGAGPWIGLGGAGVEGRF